MFELVGRREGTGKKLSLELCLDYSWLPESGWKLFRNGGPLLFE
jgi:hypothetical protein